MRLPRQIFVLALLTVLLASCSREGKVIPKSKLSRIYAEMFLADQWLDSHEGERTKADTTLFYDPIFKRFGYTFEDYDASVNYYLSDPQKFSKILKKSSDLLKAKGNRYRRIEDEIREINKRNAQIRGYRSKSFENDSLLWKRRIDTLVLDSLTLDSLRRDSLRLDSLRLDSLRLDSLRLDSLRLDSLRIDSLRKASPRQISKHGDMLPEPVNSVKE